MVFNGTHLTMPNHAAFAVGKNNGYATDDQVFICDTDSGTRFTNVGSHYNTGNGRFTAPVAGRYMFTFNVMTHDSGSNATQDWIALRVNGSTYQYFLAHKVGAYHTRFVATHIFKLSASDYVEAYVGESGTSPGWFGNASEYTSFSGFLIG